jgi:hypothetical protein
VLQGLAGRLDRRDDHDAGDPVRQVPLDRCRNGSAVKVTDAAHADGEACLSRRLLKRREQRRGTVEGGVLCDHTDHP